MNTELFARDAVLDAFEATDGRWLDKMRAVARALYERHGQPVSADDLRRAMRKHAELQPDRDNLNVMGAVFRTGFRWVGTTHSQTPGSHGNRIGLYVPSDESQEAA